MSIDIKPNPASAGSATGGLTYKGSYNATTNTPDLTSSVKGDFYIVSTGGTLAGIALNVGDHIVFNQDAASPITSAMFDVIDNTDAVSTVNGLTGAVVLNLKTINDVNATLTPSDSTFLVGDGSEWIGESGATARTSLGLTIGTDVQAYDAQLADIAGLTPTDSNFIVGDGSNFVLESGVTARTSLGCGSAATFNAGANSANQLVQLTAAGKLPAVDGSLLTNLPGGGDLLASNNLSDLANAGTARGNLGVAIGSDVQAHDAQLDDVAGLTPTDGHIIIGDGSNFVTESGATARTSLGLGTVATLDVGTGANQIVQMTAAAKLPAVDGSLLTNVTATETDTLNDVVGRGATTSTPITVGDLKINSDSSGSSTGGSIATTASNNNIKLDPHGSGVPELVGNATRGSGQVKFNCEQNTHGIVLKGPPHSAAASYTMILPDSLGSNGQFLSLQDASTGELTFSSSGAGDLLASNNLSDLDNAGTARTNLGVAIGSDVQAYDAQLDDVAGLTPTDGHIIIGDGSNFVTESGATARTSLGVAIGSDVQAYDAQLADIAGLTPTDSHIIVGDGSNFVTESGATARTSLGLAIGTNVQAYDAQLADVAGLTPADGAFIVGDGSNFVTETLATARTSLGLGTVATLDVGTGANQIVQMTAAAKLPAVDGSLLTNLPGGGGGSVPSVTTDSTGSDSTISTSTGIEEVHLISNGSTAVTITIPTASTVGSGYKYNIKRLGTANVTIQSASISSGNNQIDGSNTYVLETTNESVTLVSNGTTFFIV